MEGFEPSRTEPESAVLPLDDIPLENMLAGQGGFEPPYGGTKTRCLTAWRLPNYKINGGEAGIRTLGRLLTYTRLAGVHLQPARSPLQTYI